MVQNIAPYGILIECKAISDVLLDFIFRFSTVEKMMTAMAVGTCDYRVSDNIFNIFRRGQREYLYRSGSLFYYIERILEITHIYETIWLDKRLTDFDCELAHTYTLLTYDVINLDERVSPELLASIQKEGLVLYEKV